MISAGRVLIMPRGAFDLTIQYEMLDLVSYNGSSYIALGPTKGNLPTDTTKWMLSAYGGNAANVAGNFAVIETTSVATVQHLEGTLFVDENSQFMKATQTINIGDTIVSGTNCTPTTVEQLINEIAAYVDGLDSQNRKLFGGTEIAAQTDLHSLAIGEYYKSKTTFYVTNGPDGISNVTSAVFRLTIEAALKDGSTASSPLLLTLRTPGGKIYTQNFDGSTWGEWTILSEQIEAAENGISDIVNVLGAKNLIPYPYKDGDSVTRNGITFTVNADKSITATGTATATTVYNIAISNKICESGKQYKINGCPSGGSNSTYRLETYEPDASSQAVGIDIGANPGGTRFTSEGKQRHVIIVIYPAAGEVSLTFYPMIRPSGIEDATWQPYTKTNKELTEEVTQNSSDIQTLANETSDIFNVLGSKNLFNNTMATQVVSGVTYTVNDDKSITANGTATASASNVVGTFDFKAGVTYVLSGCPSGGSTSTYLLSIEGAGYDSGNGYEYTPSSDVTKNIMLTVYNGVTANNLVFKPMICTESVYEADNTYVPYAMTNRELTDVAPILTMDTLTFDTSMAQNSTLRHAIIKLGSYKLHVVSGHFALKKAFTSGEGQIIATSLEMFSGVFMSAIAVANSNEQIGIIGVVNNAIRFSASKALNVNQIVTANICYITT